MEQDLENLTAEKAKELTSKAITTTCYESQLTNVLTIILKNVNDGKYECWIKENLFPDVIKELKNRNFEIEETMVSDDFFTGRNSYYHIMWKLKNT
jgi:hypothetical protein